MGPWPLHGVLAAAATLVSLFCWTYDAGHRSPPTRTLRLECRNDRMMAMGSVASGSALRDAFRMTLHTRSGSIAAHFWYLSAADGELISIDFSFTIARLVEYLPGNRSGAPYDPTRTPRVKVWRPREWAPLLYETAGDVHRVTATTADGILQLNTRFTTTLRDFDALQLDPDSVRLEVEVHDFPYSRADSRLCLVAGVRSRHRRRARGSAFAGLGFETAGAPFGRFAWVPEARSGADHKVRVRLKVGKDGRAVKEGWYSGEFYYNMPTAPNEPHPSDMKWDPVVGLDDNVRSEPRRRGLWLGCAAVGAGAGGALLALRDRLRRFRAARPGPPLLFR